MVNRTDGCSSSIDMNGSYRLIPGMRQIAVAALEEASAAMWAALQQHDHKRVSFLVRAGKSDTLELDWVATIAIQGSLIKGFEALAARAHVAFDLLIQSEENTIGCSIDHPFASARLKVNVVVDPLDGSSSLRRYIELTPRPVRNLLPRPLTTITITVQLPALMGETYVTGGAIDLASDTIYSALVSPCGVAAFVNDRLLTPADLPPLAGSKLRAVVPTYAWANTQLHTALCEQLRQKLGADILGGSGSSTLDLVLLAAGLWDIIADCRALDTSAGASLRPYDVCGMLVVLRGIGGWVLDEHGREVAGYRDFNAPICFVAGRSRDLAEAALCAVIPIIAAPVAAN